MVFDRRVSWDVYNWEIPHCMKVHWTSGWKCCFCYLKKEKEKEKKRKRRRHATMVVNGNIFGVMQPLNNRQSVREITTITT